MNRVLDVGQCVPDHAAIRTLMEKRFGAEVVEAADAADALAALRAGRFDLVLVNRKLDSDYSDGLEVIRQIKADAALAKVPCMLVTNYAEHQQTAIAAGAEPGFGKASLSAPATLEQITRFLGPAK